MTERIINAERIEQLISVFGSFDENIRQIEAAFQVNVTNRGTELKISGEEEAADQGARAIEAVSYTHLEFGSGTTFTIVFPSSDEEVTA